MDVIRQAFIYSFLTYLFSIDELVYITFFISFKAIFIIYAILVNNLYTYDIFI